MEKNIISISFLFLFLCALGAQDFEVSFNGGDAVIDSLIATNLSSDESIKLPGDATLILRESTSTIYTIQHKENKISVVYPLNADEVIINFPSMLERKISIQLYDISGRLLVTKDFIALKGVNHYTISAQQHGVYIVSFIDGNDLYSTKAVLTGNSQNNISISAYKETENAKIHLKSASEDSYVLLYSSGDIISYEFYSGNSETVIHEVAGTSAILSPEFHECVDYEGNNYSIVKIGDQWWMAENLGSTRYADGNSLPQTEDNSLWFILSTTERACCFYNNDQSLGYGALYNYAAAVNGTPYDGFDQVKGICPDGWHMPSNDEWIVLQNYLIENGYNWDGSTADNKIGKSLASLDGWSGSEHIAGGVGNNPGMNNRTGFNAIPVGYRAAVTGEFLDSSISSNWWTSTEHSISEANNWYLRFDQIGLNPYHNNKKNGYSVRCIMNDDEHVVADFSVNKTEVSIGEELKFTDLSSGDPIFWTWKFGDCSRSNEQNPSHIYSSPGTYSVSLSVTHGDLDRIVKTDYIVVTESEHRTLKDSEDNIYKTVKVGKQLWMAENLKSTRYANGTPILHLTDNTEWGSLPTDNTSKAYCFYNNDEDLGYGALYTYGAAVNGIPYDGSGYVQGVCPDDWHVPAETEWDELENYLIAHGYNYDGSTTTNRIGKSLASASGWTTSINEGAVGNNQSANNSSGFNGLPGGYRSYYSTTGEFERAESGGYWWMANDLFDESAMFWNLYFDYKHVLRDYTFKRTGLSVRCMKNDDDSPLAEFIATATDAKLGDPVNFTDQSTNSPTSWLWNFGSCGATSSDQNPTHHFTREGLHSVTLITYKDNDFDIETKEGFINVTQRTGVVNDIEGNIYRTIEIGDQWWMAENLESTRYNDGSAIPLVADDSNWIETFTPAYSWYDDDETSYGGTYGALYNWHTVNTGKMCPSGWHVPTDNEWKQLEMALGMSAAEADRTKERGPYTGSKLAGNADLWSSPDIKSNPHFETSGFMALPGGRIDVFTTSESQKIGIHGYWWSSTEFGVSAGIRGLYSSDNRVFRSISSDKRAGLSVRCVKD